MKISNKFNIMILHSIGASFLFVALSNVERGKTKDEASPGSVHDLKWRGSKKINSGSAKQAGPAYDALVVARYLESKVVLKTNFAEQVIKSNDLGVAIGGRVYMFEIQRIICGEENGKTEPTLSIDAKLAFFNEDGSGFYQPFDPQRSYLIYLSPIPDPKKLKEDFELDPQTTYYTPYPFDGKKTHKKSDTRAIGRGRCGFPEETYRRL